MSKNVSSIYARHFPLHRLGYPTSPWAHPGEPAGAFAFTASSFPSLASTTSAATTTVSFDVMYICSITTLCL